HGDPPPGEVAQRGARPQGLILIETTPAALRALKPYGWDKRFPYALGDPKNGSFNTAVYSRFPLSGSSQLGHTSFQQWATTVRVPRVGALRLLAVHPCNPYCGGDRWSPEHRQVRRAVIDNLAQPLDLAA